ncbi:MAG: ABC transporter substrate-binding protein [Hyphomicrobiaceae bacterium]|nr:ABC transporter substrate-binding protein [Hyphomicrobiaceae bacterium]
MTICAEGRSRARNDQCWQVSVRASACLAIAVSLVCPPAAPARAQGADQPAAAAKPAPAAEVTQVRLVYLREERERLPPLSLLSFPPDDDGIAGAQLGIDDNETTGRFLKQSFSLDVASSPKREDLIKDALAAADSGIGFFIVDASADTLLALSDALKDKNAVLFNAGARDERLREEDCRLNIKHTSASYTMLTDALAQYLAWKRWGKTVLIKGPTPQDEQYAAALRRSMARFGLKILTEKTFEYAPGSRRSDGGFEQVQQQIPSFTQDLPDHDVLLVADEVAQFGDYFPYRTWTPRPVAGTHGLYPTTWHPASELWGATQFQNRFRRKSERTMRPLDYAAWMAVRSIGEAATRTKSGDPKILIDYMLSDKFELAAFKGQKLTYRPWNAQIRQPIFVAAAPLHISVSPQQGFLHQVTPLDTLGVDKPESKCRAFDGK